MLALRMAGVMAAGLLSACAAWAAPVETTVGTGPGLTIVNDTGQPVHYLYIERPNGGWPEDLLMEDVLAAGATYLVQTDRPDCVYDVKVVFADGSSVDRPYFDICATPRISLAALLGEDALAGKASGAGAPPPPPSPPPPPPPPPAPTYVMSPEPEEAAPPRAAAPDLDRGVPICPGDRRCKETKP